MTEPHAEQEFLDAAFGPRKRERLACAEEAKKDPAFAWFELWRPAESSSKPVLGRVAPSVSRTPPGSRPLSRTCGCCGRLFAGRRSDALFCGLVCQKRARRGRCEEAA
jgi:hypothetical protein